MTREPKIPMSPKALPQQRIHEVIVLPERPAVFDCVVGYREFPRGALPRKLSSNSTYLCQVEWAWSPAHNRLDAYYLHRGRTHWSLWCKHWDNDWTTWESNSVGCVPRRGIEEKQAAVYLLLEFWADDAKESYLDRYHWINEGGYLSISEIAAIAREVW
jgi:hypothetical protein